MKRVYLFICSLCLCVPGVRAQYAPQAGLPGSSAISAASSRFVAWATHCHVQRGYMDIANPSLGYASAGDSSQAIGAPDYGIVSLGDSGVAVLTFASPVYDGPVADFAVFENGFLDIANDSLAFLELAFVEVSSDGVHYFRFPASSLTQNNVQVGNGDYLDASLLHNLAGKYVATYGTPFDLQELADTPGLDVHHITHIRIVDVVGSILAHASHDNSGRVINDPYPTPYPSGGFDLDAVGVIHQVSSGVPELNNKTAVSVYPNPATDKIVIAPYNGWHRNMDATLTTITGTVLQHTLLTQSKHTLSIEQYPAGMYYLILQGNGNRWAEKITKR